MRQIGIQLFYKAIDEYNKNQSLEIAIKIQNRYANIIKNNYKKWEECNLNNPLIGGIDIAFVKNNIIAGIVILDSFLNVTEKKFIITKAKFPYIPGFLSFRELDAIIQLFDKIQNKPNILCFDGQGIAHPRFMGIATHGGILLDIPSIGIGKTKLVGNYQEPPLNKGSKSALLYQNLQVGWVYRSKTNTKPIYLSPGWKFPLDQIPDFILPFCKYRIPEPTRLAHNYVNQVKKNQLFNKDFM
jgi:Deoxyinosine 3'endonuclease (endonuclease V)